MATTFSTVLAESVMTTSGWVGAKVNHTDNSTNLTSIIPSERHTVSFSDVAHDFVAAILFFIWLFAFWPNLAILIVIIKTKYLRTPMNWLIFNLSLSDFLVSLFGNPFSFASSIARRWLFGVYGCNWYGFANNVFGIVSIIQLTFIALERYCIMTKPFTMGKLSNRGARIAIFCVWIYSLIFTVPPLFGWNSYVKEGPKTGCSVDWESGDGKSYIWVLVTFCFFIPIIIIVFCYYKVIKAVKEAARVQTSGSAAKAEVNVTVMCVVMVACFTFAWTPYALMALYVTIFSPKHFPPAAAIAPSLFAKASTAYNPIILIIMNQQFRKALRTCFGCCKPNAVQVPSSPGKATIGVTAISTVKTGLTVPGPSNAVRPGQVSTPLTVIRQVPDENTVVSMGGDSYVATINYTHKAQGT